MSPQSKLTRADKFWIASALVLMVVTVLLSGYLTPESSVISLPVSLIFLIIGQFIFRKEKSAT